MVVSKLLVESLQSLEDQRILGTVTSRLFDSMEIPVNVTVAFQGRTRPALSITISIFDRISEICFPGGTLKKLIGEKL